jgi:outer membrane protein assembly factor BamB
LPADSHVSALNVLNDVIYATTSGRCGGNPNAVYGIDMGSADKKVVSYQIAGSSLAGPSGTALGSDGTVYVQVLGELAETSATSHRTVLALNPATLAVKDFFVGADRPAVKGRLGESAPTPTVFSWKGRDMVIAAGSDGRLDLLDSASLGGADHHKAAFETEPVASDDQHYAGDSFRAGFSTWTDSATDARWIYASLSGPPRSSAKFPVQNGDVSTGSIVAFKLEEKAGQPVLTPAWISSNILSPAAPVTASGMVFALSTGEPLRQSSPKGKALDVADIQKGSTHAALYVLDGETGKQLFSSGEKVASPAFSSGLAVANGRIYFGTSDNNMNAFGFKAMQPQLTDK